MDPTNIIMFLLFFCVTGAIAVDPQAQKNQWNVLTGVTMWNGKPQHEFRINWFHLLCGALGAIVQEGWTLLQTARNQDLGSPGNPGTPQDARKSTNRNVRLYHCIANYIDKSCSIYRDAQLLFPDDGRALFNYIWHKGERAFTARQQIRREAKWKDASISALAIPIDEDTPITWKEWCLTEGRKLGKNLLEIRDKYLEGFPTSFDVVILAEKNSTANAGNGNFVRPGCGGRGHPVSIDGVVCASKQLGVKVPRELLEGTTYSDGITFPKLSNRPPTRRTSSTGAGSSAASVTHQLCGGFWCYITLYQRHISFRLDRSRSPAC